jgi:hypothetical protein
MKEKLLSPEAMKSVLTQLYISRVFCACLDEAPSDLMWEINTYYWRSMPHISSEDWITKTRDEVDQFITLSERIPLERFLEIMGVEKEKFQQYLELNKKKKRARRRVENAGEVRGETIEGSMVLRAEVNSTIRAGARSIVELAKAELEAPDRNDLYCMWLFLQIYVTGSCQIL